jgi:hypothetical protein
LFELTLCGLFEGGDVWQNCGGFVAAGLTSRASLVCVDIPFLPSKRENWTTTKEYTDFIVIKGPINMSTGNEKQNVGEGLTMSVVGCGMFIIHFTVSVSTQAPLRSFRS